jgi:hypothetical protein
VRFDPRAVRLQQGHVQMLFLIHSHAAAAVETAERTWKRRTKTHKDTDNFSSCHGRYP